MPTYDYECEACEHKFELFQAINDAVKKKCPDCGKNKLRRLFGTGAAIVFKGSGFYTTDYRSDSYRKDAKADSDSRKADSAKGESGNGESGNGESGKGESGKGESGKGESKKGESKSGDSPQGNSNKTDTSNKTKGSDSGSRGGGKKKK